MCMYVTCVRVCMCEYVCKCESRTKATRITRVVLNRFAFLVYTYIYSDYVCVCALVCICVLVAEPRASKNLPCSLGLLCLVYTAVD